MSLQIEFKWQIFTCPTQLIDPSLPVETHKTTIGNIILSLMHSGDKIEELYFRHFSRTSEGDTKWELVVHQHLFAEASKLSDKLEEVLQVKHGIESSKYFYTNTTMGSYAATAAAQLLEFTLEDTDDMYFGRQD